MKIALIIVSWLQSGPFVQIQNFESLQQCNAAVVPTSLMIRQQAQTNLASPHNELIIFHDKNINEWTVTTKIIGRELIRLKCVRIK